MSARQELEQVRAEIACLKARELELIGLAQKEADEEAAREKLREWVAVRTIATAEENGVAIYACRTPKVIAGRMLHYWIWIASEKQILSILAVTEWRTVKYMSKVHGDHPPVEFELRIRREFDLSNARRA